MRTQSIYNKLAKTREIQAKAKTPLSKCKYDFSKKNKRPVKVGLSVIDDLKSEYEWFEKIYSIASYYAYGRIDELRDKYDDAVSPISLEIDELIINSGVNGLDEVTRNVSDYLERINDIAERIGVPATELYPEIITVSEQVADAGSVYEDVKREVNDFIKEKQISGFTLG